MTILLRSYFTKEVLLEVLAVLFSIAYTVLITKQNILCWPAALVASCIFIYLCYSKKLLAETTLHIFYFFIAIYGWITWGIAKDFTVTSYGIKTNLILIVIGILFFMLSGTLLKIKTKAALPFVDSFTTIFSFIATYMMIHLVIENWIYWIVIDSISVFLYAKRGLYIAGGLYVIYTFLAIKGYITWLG